MKLLVTMSALSVLLAAFASATGPIDPIVNAYDGTLAYQQAVKTNGDLSDIEGGEQTWALQFMSGATCAAQNTIFGKWNHKAGGYSADLSEGFNEQVKLDTGDPQAKGKLKLPQVSLAKAVGVNGTLKLAETLHGIGVVVKVKSNGTFLCPIAP